jgi:hypothetical protein
MLTCVDAGLATFEWRSTPRLRFTTFGGTVVRSFTLGARMDLQLRTPETFRPPAKHSLASEGVMSLISQPAGPFEVAFAWRRRLTPILTCSALQAVPSASTSACHTTAPQAPSCCLPQAASWPASWRHAMKVPEQTPLPLSASTKRPRAPLHRPAISDPTPPHPASAPPSTPPAPHYSPAESPGSLTPCPHHPRRSPLHQITPPWRPLSGELLFLLDLKTSPPHR